MTIEYIRYAIPIDRAADFRESYRLAAQPLIASRHCLAYELSQCSEDPASWILRIEWDSVEGHLEGFRKSPEFREFLGHIRPWVDAIEEMRHYEVVATGSA